jgi:hypothetical protein
MFAVWYPTEVLQGAGGTPDVYGVVLVTVLFLEGLAHIGRRWQS